MTSADLIVELKKRFNKVLSKRGSLLVGLWGEAGIGKSWLVEQLLQDISCQKVSLLANTSVIEFIGKLPQPSNLPTWVKKSLKNLSSSESVEPTVVNDTVTALLVALAPIVVHIDDWHKASPEQIDVWMKLAEVIKSSRGIGFIISSRTEVKGKLETYRLEPLSTKDVLAMLESEAKATLPTGALSWIYERSQGNPLFTLEYFRYLARLGHLWSDGQRWRWRPPTNEFMPISIEALIAQLFRSAITSPEIETALSAKALLPKGTSDSLWGKIAGLKPKALREAKAELENQGILVAGEFSHPLMYEVAQRELPQAKRSQLARQAIELLQEDKPKEAAFFVDQAALPLNEAKELLKQAAEAAKASENELEVAHFLASAANYASGTEQVNLALEAAKLLQNINVSKAAKTNELALKADPQNVEAILLQASLLSSLGQGDEAEALLQRLSQAKSVNLEWLEALIAVQVNRYNYAEAWELWLNHTEIHQAASIPTRVHIGQSLTQLGMFTEAKGFLKAALNIPTISPLDKAWLISNYAIIPLTEGDFKAALSSLNEAIAIYDEVLDGTLDIPVQQKRSVALSNRSLVLYRLGRFQEAIVDLEKYLQIVSEQGNGRKYAEGQVNLGTYLIEVGKFERAEEVLMESCEVLERSNNIRWLVIAQQTLVQLYLDWAPPYGSALALRHAQATEGYVRRAQSPPQLAEALYFISRAEAEHGQAQRALELVEEMKTLATNLGQPRLEVAGTWVRGLAFEKLGQREEALETLAEAVGQMRRLGYEPFSHRLALEIDRIKGDSNAAKDRIQHFKGVDGLNWLNITYRYFPELASIPEPTKVISSAVYLRVLGPLVIEVNGSPLNYSANKGKALLALLLEARIAGRSEVSQLDLLDNIYSDMDEKRATSALKQLVYRLRSSLGSQTIGRTNNGYAIGEIGSDAEDFLSSGDPSLWRSPYLQGLDESWDSSTREALYHALRLQIAEQLQNDPQESIRLAQILLEANPYEQEVLAFCLDALQNMNNKSLLESFYKQSCEQFVEVGEQLPAAWEDFLADYKGNLVMA